MPNKCRCDGSHVHIKVKGRGDNGEVITAPLKQYPPPLCGVVARAAHKKFAKALPNVSVDWGVFDLSEQYNFSCPWIALMLVRGGASTATITPGPSPEAIESHTSVPLVMKALTHICTLPWFLPQKRLSLCLRKR